MKQIIKQIIKGTTMKNEEEINNEKNKDKNVNIFF